MDFDIRLKKLSTAATVPVRAHKTDAGLDVFARSDATILGGEDYLFPLGWSVAVPQGYVMIVKEKSGRAVNNKLHVGACVIDPGYRGEVHCHLFNAGQDVVRIKAGEKIAQIIVVPVWSGSFIEVDELDDTPRGAGGFGSTGL